MAKRRTSRQAARRRSGRAHRRDLKLLYRRPLRHELLEDRRLLALVTVDTLADTIDFNDGVTSLREAIFATNTVPGADTIEFAPSLTAGGPATILLTHGELRITDHLTINGPAADLLTIDASGSDPTPEVNDQRGSGVLQIAGSPNVPQILVAISGLTLTGADTPNPGGGIFNSGNLTLEGMRIIGNNAGELGGGIAHRNGTLQITQSELSGNSTPRGSGGAIHSIGELVVAHSRIANNTAARNGGGIAHRNGSTAGSLTVTDSTISGNTASNIEARGGGIYFVAFLATAEHNFSISGSTISQNRASFTGGGISVAMQGGTIRLKSNTIEGNSVTISTSRGGGIYADLIDVNATITGQTIRNNSAVRGGGGIRASNIRGQTLVAGSTILNNRVTGIEGIGGGVLFSGDASTSTLQNSIVAGNTALGVTGRGGGIFAASGRVNIIGSSISGNTAQGSGGGIYSNGLQLLAESTITGNAVVGPKSSGGGIYHRATRELLITDSEFTDNSAVLKGGGAYLTSTSAARLVTINHSNFSENAAGQNGGGIAVGTAELTIADSTFRGNSAGQDGGGIWNTRSTLTLTNSRLTENRADGDGGGIANQALNFSIRDNTFDLNEAGRDGGGLLSSARSPNIVGNTFSGNTAERNGGGIAVRGGPFAVTNSTFSGNTAGELGGGVWSGVATTLLHSTVFANEAGIAGGGAFAGTGSISLNHTIVAGNTAPNGRDFTGFIGTSIQANYSLIGTHVGTGLLETPSGPDANGNLIGGPVHGVIDPRLGPLAYNGGPTMTHALLPNSPAINAGDPAAMAGVGGVPLYDQRGEPFTRVYGGRIDIGAFERQPNPLPGDYNFNGVVDLADFAVWRDTLGSISDLRADGNENGIIDEADQMVWRANLGRTRESVQQGAARREQGVGSGEQGVESGGLLAVQARSIDAPKGLAEPAAFNGGVALQRQTLLRGAGPREGALVAWVTSRGTTREQRVGFAPSTRRAARFLTDDVAALPASAFDHVFEAFGGLGDFEDLGGLSDD